MTPPQTGFTRDQLVFVVEAVLVAIWDRVESYMPDSEVLTKISQSPEEIAEEAAGFFAGLRAVFDAFVPILYAQLTDDGLGIGDFAESDYLKDAVAVFLRRRLDPRLNTNGRTVRHPDTHEMAEDVVCRLFTEYLTPVPRKKGKPVKNEPEYGWDDEHDTPARRETT